MIKKVIFESTVIFKDSHVYLHSSARQPDSQTDSQPAVSPGWAKCRVSKITLNNGLICPINETAILKTIIPMRYGGSLVLPSNAFFSIQRYA